MRVEIKLAAGITPDTGERLAEAFITRFWTLWSNVLLSKFKVVTPYATGQLRRSLKAGIQNDKFIIIFRPAGFYWRFQPGLADTYTRIFNANIEGMIELAHQQAMQDVGL